MVAIYKSGMGAALQDIAVISNNIANAGTISFKRSDTILEDIYATEKNRTSEIRLGNGVQKLEPRRAHQQGSFIMTNAALDLAINGEGFFAIKNPSNPDELKYTRNGSINLTNEGELVTMEGFKYLDKEGNEIKIPFTVIDDQENVRREGRERAKQREERERSRESGSDSERGICNHRTPPKAKSLKRNNCPFFTSSSEHLNTLSLLS